MAQIGSGGGGHRLSQRRGYDGAGQERFADLARDELPDGAALKMMVRVRDEAGQVIGEAILDMNSVEFGGGS